MANVPKTEFSPWRFKGKIYVKKLGTYLKWQTTSSAQLSTWFITTDFFLRWSELSLVYYTVLKCNDFLKNNELIINFFIQNRFYAAFIFSLHITYL